MKNERWKVLQELSVNTLHQKLNKSGHKSGHKNHLKKKYPMSDEEDKECNFWVNNEYRATRKCLIPFPKESSEGDQITSLENLPCELHRIILTFLPWNELLRTIQLLSMHWRQLLLECWVWKLINESQPLNLSQRIRKIQWLAERRSKGKQFKAINRINGNYCSVRKIFLDVTNAGQDDGLPTSVLRELSHLKSIEHPNIAK